MKVYIYGSVIDVDEYGLGLIPGEQTAVTDNGLSLYGDTWRLENYNGDVYNEEGNPYAKSTLGKLILLDEASKLFKKMADAGQFDDYTESVLLSSIAFVSAAEHGTIDDTTATEHIGAFSPWEAGMEYSQGNIRSYNGKLYRCVQAHTSQENWTPDVAASLWTAIGDPAEEWPEWSQPVGAHDAYMTGDKVSYNDAHWISTVDNNVWQPGVYGWEQQ